MSKNARIEELANELKELAPNITVEERMRAAIKLLVSEKTVFRYLNGEVRKIHLASKMLEHFKKVIGEKGLASA